MGRKVTISIMCICALPLIYFVIIPSKENLIPISGKENLDQMPAVNTSKEILIPTSDKENLDQMPDFAMYLRMHAPKRKLYETIFVQSMKYFWMIKSPLVIILDKNEEDITFGKEISQKYPYPEVYHEEPFDSKYYHNDGHKLQQLSMFHAEKYFKYKYIGFIDTDAMFVSVVTPDQLFVGGKPVIIGEYGSAANSFWYEVSKMTELALGKKEVFRCMSYFPVMMLVKHLAEMRDYMAKLHNMDFNKVFQTFTSKPFSQFSIMCTYLWYFHRDEYTFHAQLRPSNGKWNGEYTSPGRHGPAYYKENVPEEMRFPVVRATIHYKYVNAWEAQTTFRIILKLSLCHSGGFDICPQTCQSFNRSAVMKHWFLFEFIDWTWDKRCIIAQKKHVENIAKLNKTETRRRILNGCMEVDKLPFNLET